MAGKVYAFVAVGRGVTEKGDKAMYVRIGRCKPKCDWQRLHHGPSTPEEVLMETAVPDAKAAMSKLISILRGNEYYGAEKHRLDGWHEELLVEKAAFGSAWFETVYTITQLRDIFKNIGMDFKQ